MQIFLVLGAVLGLGYLWIEHAKYKPGQGPLDQLPAGVVGAPAGARDETASSGRIYRVYYWAPGADNRQFHVAELKGAHAWVSYWFDRASGKRTLYAAIHHGAEQLEQLRKDYGL